MSDALVDRAEALMGRRRSFVATPPQAPLDRLGPPAEAIPVLTEIVALPDPVESRLAGESVSPIEAVLHDLGGDLANSIAERLASELPGLLDAALAALASDLKSGIAAATETALAEFITRRKQLPLPFPEEPGERADSL